MDSIAADNLKKAGFDSFGINRYLKTLASYAGWNLWGNLAAVLQGQGVNVLLNIFLDP